MPGPLPRAPIWAFALFMALFGGASIWLGPDASWDLRNYHLYDAHAFLSGTLWRDIAPAQLQSFYPPLLDTAMFVLRRALNAHPVVLAVLLAVPHALAAQLAVCIALRMGLPVGVAVLAVLFGATGAAGLPTVGSAMSEAVPECLVLAALLALCRPSTGMTAGLLAGGAVGLKLTFAPYGLGLAAALCGTGRWRHVPGFVLGGLIATLALAGPWCWSLWVHTGNPLFPYFNQVFRSAWAALAPMTDRRFLPADAFHAALFPAFWALRPSRLVAEFPVRDPRLALAWLGWVALLVNSARRPPPPNPLPQAGGGTRKESPPASERDAVSNPPSPPDQVRGLREGVRGRATRTLLLFWTIAFVGWEAEFSVFRYTATLELLAGIPIALALAPLRARTLAPVFAVIGAFTVYPHWSRASGPLAMDVHPPAFGPRALVLLLDSAPMAYVAAFVPSDVRFVGINSNLVRPDGATVPARAARLAVAARDGPLWGLESQADQPGSADRALSAYGLARAGPCERVRSNLDGDAILACRLIPTQPPRVRVANASSQPSAPLMAMPATASSTTAANMRGISSR